MQLPLPVKHVIVLMKLKKLNDCINHVNARQLLSMKDKTLLSQKC